jgi:hypothetical protein
MEASKTKDLKQDNQNQLLLSIHDGHSLTLVLINYITLKMRYNQPRGMESGN